MRDLRSIYAKLLQVLYPPKGGGNNELLRCVHKHLRVIQLTGQRLGSLGTAGHLPRTRDCLVDRCELRQLSALNLADEKSPPEQSMQVFSLVISLITIGTVVVTINSKLLGGKV